jgi:signal transduction histidine kinase/FixJ family two-component response regulator
MTEHFASRQQDLIRRFNLWLLAFSSLVGLGALLFVLPHGRPEDTVPRLAIPLSIIASSLLAMWLTRYGRARLGAALVIFTAYASILYYVIAGGYGLHSYTLGLYSMLIVATALMIGHHAGLVAAAIAVLTAVALYWFEQHGILIYAETARTIPLSNIFLVNVILYVTIGCVLYVFSKSFRVALRWADIQGKHLQQLIELAPQGYVLHRDGAILMLNQAAANAAGIARIDAAAVSQMVIYDLLHPDDQMTARNNMHAASALAFGASLAVEYRSNPARGHAGTYETWTTPVTLEDGAALLTIVRDVTRERADTAALAAAKSQAEAANQTKSQFLANMSHEIRTPMNAVLGLSELLLSSRLDNEQRVRTEGIRSSARALLSVINNVLDVSRMEAGKTELTDGVFEPRALLESVHAMMQPLAQEKSLVFQVRTNESVPAAVVGDEGRLRQILVNLVGNAVKFTARGRVEIELRTGKAADAGALTGSNGVVDAVTLVFRVTDSGPGIPAAQLGTLFERFVQADGTSTRQHGGSGLGLYIARELARLMGGDIEVQSVPGVGSSFTVRVNLRLVRADDKASPHALAEATESSNGARRRRSVLLVEDNDINRMIAESMLGAVGHRVTLAVDGAEAVASCAAQVFDCVLMDCQMPVMDGVEATRRIRAGELEYGRRHTPIVALTANAMQGDREKYLEAGMDDFLAKPFESAELLAMVERITHAGDGMQSAVLREREQSLAGAAR